MISNATTVQDQRDMCERYNFNALDFTKKKVLAVLPGLLEREAEIDAMIALVNEELIDQLVHFSAEEGIDSLAELIINCLQDNVELTKQNVHDWIDHYRVLEQDASRRHHQQIRYAEPNIINYLKAGDQRAMYALGDNYDINALLKDVMSHTEGVASGNVTRFESNTDYILPAVSIVVSHAERDLLNPVQIIAERLQAIIQQTNSAGENINVYIPANCSQGHWVLVHFTINGDKVTAASITDSMSGNSTATSQVKKVLLSVNGDKKTKVVRNNLRVQTNGFSCMDFTLKHALYNAKTIQLDEHLIAIRDARDQVELRRNVIKALYQKHPDLQRIYREHQERKLAADSAKAINNELQSLIAQATQLPTAERLAFFKKHCDLFKFGQIDMAPVLACLMPSDQTEIVRFVFDSYVNSFEKLEQCLEYLPEEDKFDHLLRKYFVIKSAEQILRLATLVPANRAEEYWMRIAPYIDSAAVLTKFLSAVPTQEMRDKLINIYAKRVNSQQLLLEFMEVLAPEMRSSVLGQHPALLQIDPTILARLEHKKTQKVNETIDGHKPESSAELYEMMKDYDQSSCLLLLEQSLGRFKFLDTENFPAVLGCIPVEKRWLIAQQSQEYITKQNIRAVKKVLDVKHRNELILKHQNKFNSTAEMVAELDAGEQYKYAKGAVGKPEGTAVIGALNNKAKTDITTYSKIIFELNRYLTYKVKLHDERVRELQAAVKSADSINDVVDLIQSQIDLMRFNGKPSSKFASRNFSFLNHAPGKKLLSIGYKMMLRRCERAAGLKR